MLLPNFLKLCALASASVHLYYKKQRSSGYIWSNAETSTHNCILRNSSEGNSTSGPLPDMSFFKFELKCCILNFK
jgi:hypothetical protein